MPRSPKGRAAARGRDSASNKLSCLLEMLHSKQLRSIKMLIDSNHGIYRGENTGPGKDVHGELDRICRFPVRCSTHPGLKSGLVRSRRRGNSGIPSTRLTNNASREARVPDGYPCEFDLNSPRLSPARRFGRLRAASAPTPAATIFSCASACVAKNATNSSGDIGLLTRKP
jgi:hypothetical protein